MSTPSARPSITTGLCAALVALSVAFTGSAAIAAGPGSPPQESTAGVGPPQSDFFPAFLQSQSAPDLAPSGSNDWSCRPSAEQPRPVVLVHGTWSNAYVPWAELAPELKQDGRCVFALNYGVPPSGLGQYLSGAYGTADIATSARELAVYVDAVLAATGARQIDLVGHSQGGPLSLQYLRFDGGTDPTDPARNKVHTLVTLAGTNHGTTLDGIGSLARQLQDSGVNVQGVIEPVVGISAVQQVVGSPFLENLAAGGDTQPGVSYTAIATRFDEVSTPFAATFLTAGPGATVRNITLQDGCDLDRSDHLSITYSPRALFYVRQALEPGRLADQPAPCVFNPPVG